jgi:hypothetical protein
VPLGESERVTLMAATASCSLCSVSLSNGNLPRCFVLGDVSSSLLLLPPFASDPERVASAGAERDRKEGVLRTLVRPSFCASKMSVAKRSFAGDAFGDVYGIAEGLATRRSE